MDYIAIGQRIRQARKKHKQTQEELAKQVGLSASFLGHIERGTRIMSLETLEALCKALLISADYLLDLNDLPILEPLEIPLTEDEQRIAANAVQAMLEAIRKG